ncbi:hypothetical protein IWX49DRAFT_152554 [Phyllosticta citricarpa]
MSAERPRLPGRGAVLYGVGPFLRRRSNPGTGNGGAADTSSPAPRDQTPITCDDGMLPMRRSPVPQLPGRNAQFPVDNGGLSSSSPPTVCPPDVRSVETERIYAGQLDFYRQCVENSEILRSFAAELGVSVEGPFTQDSNDSQNLAATGTLAHAGTRAPRAKRASRVPAERVTNKKATGWGPRKEYQDCSKSERRRRDKALEELEFYWELSDHPTENKLSILEELQPIEALQNRGFGVHDKPSIDQFFNQQFYSKDDRDCSSNFLGLLSCFAQLYCGDRRLRGLDLLRHHANRRQIPANNQHLSTVMELLCCDIKKAIEEPSLEKIMVHPSQKQAARLQGLRKDISTIEEEGVKAMLQWKEIPHNLRSWIKSNNREAQQKLGQLAGMIKLEKKRLAQLAAELSRKLQVQMQQLPPRAPPVLEDLQELQINMSFYRPGRPLSYTVEFPGQEITYEDVMKGDFSPTVRASRMKIDLPKLKKRCKKQQSIIDRYMRQLHRRAMRYVKGRLISKKAQSEAINEYIHTHKTQARRLHQALLKSAQLKASVRLVNFHIRAQAMTL